MTANVKLFTAWEEGKDFPPPQGTSKRTSGRLWQGLILPTNSLRKWLLNWSEKIIASAIVNMSNLPGVLNFVARK